MTDHSVCEVERCNNPASELTPKGYLVCGRCYEELVLILPPMPPILVRLRAWAKNREWFVDFRPSTWRENARLNRERKAKRLAADDAWNEIKAEEQSRHW